MRTALRQAATLVVVALMIMALAGTALAHVPPGEAGDQVACVSGIDTHDPEVVAKGASDGINSCG